MAVLRPNKGFQEMFLSTAADIAIGGAGAGCFVAGTLVLTSKGYKPIENVAIGELVASLNESTKQVEYKEVVNTLRLTATQTVTADFYNGKTITCTLDHEFYINGEFMPIFDIATRRCAWRLSGPTYGIATEISGVKEFTVNISSRLTNVFDLTVKDNHNYLITEDNIIVHNCGKSMAALMEPLRNIHNKDFGAVFFRRTFAQIKNEGGLWDESAKMYPSFGAKPNSSDFCWHFPSKASVSFSHLQHENDIYNHQGAQYPLIVLDEATHFTEKQFWYLLSRNRTTCGVKPYMRLTCNPDPDSFIARLIEWYIDADGYPIKEKIGAIRYFMRNDTNMIWGNSKDEVISQNTEVIAEMLEAEKSTNPHDLVKSFTFIPGSIYDNKQLLKHNPEYLSNLLALDEVEKQRLLYGNWKVSQDKTALFDFSAINDVFNNYPHTRPNQKYITCDAARYGRDFCVIMVWNDWEVVFTEVIKQSDAADIVGAIERLRAKYNIMKSNVLVDRDGVGSGSVKLGAYQGFGGGEKARDMQGKKANYKNLKTQCYYYLAEQCVNVGNIKINVNSELCRVDGVMSDKIMVGKEVRKISDLIIQDLRAIKRDKLDSEGKQCINSKEAQKIILGRSPDFGDCLMQRCFFEFLPKRIIV